jgi:hypothetical protein
MRYALAAAALVLLAACQPAAAPEAEAPAAPATPLEQIQAQDQATQLVTAYQALIAYQQAHPETQPACSAVRATESRGVIPADVDPASTYGPLAGSAVYSIQCGALLSGTRYDPVEHWLVVYAPAATEVSVVNCANAQGLDTCPRDVPRTATPASAPAAP